jgi:hypothetical protein
MVKIKIVADLNISSESVKEAAKTVVTKLIPVLIGVILAAINNFKIDL